MDLVNDVWLKKSYTFASSPILSFHVIGQENLTGESNFIGGNYIPLKDGMTIP